MSKAAKRAKKKEALNSSIPQLDSISAEAPLQKTLNTSGAQSVASNAPSPSPVPSSSRRKSKATPASAGAPVQPTPKGEGKDNPPADSNNFGPIQSSLKKKPDPPAPNPTPAPPKPAKGAKTAAPKPSQPASGPSKSASTQTPSTSTSKKNKKANVHALSQTSAATSSGTTTPVPVPASFGAPTPALATQLSAASSSFNVTAAPFIPGTGTGGPIRITTPNGDALTFEGQAPPRPKAKAPAAPNAKRPSAAERPETKAQKADQLAKAKEEKKRKEEEVRRAKEEEKQRAREEERRLREAAEKARDKAEKAKVKAERKRKANEAKRKAEEEKEQKAWEEEQRALDEVRRLEAARRSEEARRLEEAEREARENAEKAESKKERKRKNKQAKRIAKEEEEARLKAEVAAKADEEGEEQDTSPALASLQSANNPLPPTVPGLPSPLPKSNPTSESPECPVPNSLEHSIPRGSPVAMPAPARAPPTEDLNAAPYFQEVGKPNSELGISVAPSPSRYSRDFLLQFMNDCKDRPHSLPPLGSIGLEPREQGKSPPSNPRAGDRHPVGFTTMGDVFKELGPKPAPTKPAPTKPGGFSVGNSKTPWSRMSDSQSRPDASTSTRGGVPSAGLAGGRPAPTTLTGRPIGVPRALRPTEPAAPPKASNRWLGGSLRCVPATIQGLLNKLTADNFVAISNRIIQLADRSEQIKNGSLLMRIAKLVFNSARNDPMYGEMYARLCRKMIKSLSPNIQDDMVCDWGEQPVTGGMLFRKYLLHLCQEEFERGWNVKWAELTAVSKVKRQGLGLVRFMGELFKLKLLTERTMHECIKKFLSNNIKPKEEDIESLCELLATAGRMLDNRRARNHMDIFFERMNGIANKGDLSWRIRFMLQDVIDLRARNWQTRL